MIHIQTIKFIKSYGITDIDKKGAYIIKLLHFYFPNQSHWNQFYCYLQFDKKTKQNIKIENGRGKGRGKVTCHKSITLTEYNVIDMRGINDNL